MDKAAAPGHMAHTAGGVALEYSASTGGLSFGPLFLVMQCNLGDAPSRAAGARMITGAVGVNRALVYVVRAAGGSAGSLVGDVRCLIRLHTALVRTAAHMRASAQQQQAPVALAHALTAPKAHVTRPSAVMHAEQGQATPLANGNASHAGDMECSSPDGDAAMQEPSSSHRREGASTPLHWQAAEGSGLVSIAAVGLEQARLAVTAPGGSGSGSNPAHMQQPPGMERSGSAIPGNNIDFRLTIEWALGNAGGQPQVAASGLVAAAQGAGDAQRQQLRCCMRAEPAVPTDVLRSFEAMAGVQRFLLLLATLPSRPSWTLHACRGSNRVREEDSASSLYTMQ